MPYPVQLEGVWVHSQSQVAAFLRWFDAHAVKFELHAQEHEPTFHSCLSGSQSLELLIQSQEQCVWLYMMTFVWEKEVPWIFTTLTEIWVFALTVQWWSFCAVGHPPLHRCRVMKEGWFKYGGSFGTLIAAGLGRQGVSPSVWGVVSVNQSNWSLTVSRI